VLAGPEVNSFKDQEVVKTGGTPGDFPRQLV